MLDWDKYMRIATRFRFKARAEDRNDLQHDIIVALAEAERAERNESDGEDARKLSDDESHKIARYQCQKYWRGFKKRRNRMVSLEHEVETGNGYRSRLLETISDNGEVDMDACLDARGRVVSLPQRIIDVAFKMLSGEKLCNREHQMLFRFRNRLRKNGQR